MAVAWADGNIDAKERGALISAAEQSGLHRQSPGHASLENWLAKKPSRDLTDAWKAYVSGLAASMPEDARRSFKSELLERARSVAEAAGGFLGLTGRISAAEQAVLTDLEWVFEA